MDGSISKSLLWVLFCYLMTLSCGVEYTEEECKNFKLKNEVHSCCKISTSNEQDMAASVEVSNKCISTILENKTMPTEIEEQREKIECMEECVFNGYHWLTPDLKLNPEAIIAGFPALFSGDDWKELVQNAIRDCIKNNVVSTVKENAKCKSGAFQLVECFSREIYLNCPDNAWQSSKEECNDAKDIVRNCPRFLTMS